MRAQKDCEDMRARVGAFLGLLVPDTYMDLCRTLDDFIAQSTTLGPARTKAWEYNIEIDDALSSLPPALKNDAHVFVMSFLLWVDGTIEITPFIASEDLTPTQVAAGKLLGVLYYEGRGGEGGT